MKRHRVFLWPFFFKVVKKREDGSNYVVLFSLSEQSRLKISMHEWGTVWEKEHTAWSNINVIHLSKDFTGRSVDSPVSFWKKASRWPSIRYYYTQPSFIIFINCVVNTVFCGQTSIKVRVIFGSLYFIPLIEVIRTIFPKSSDKLRKSLFFL